MRRSWAGRAWAHCERRSRGGSDRDVSCAGPGKRRGAAEGEADPDRSALAATGGRLSARAAVGGTGDARGSARQRAGTAALEVGASLLLPRTGSPPAGRPIPEAHA